MRGSGDGPGGREETAAGRERPARPARACPLGTVLRLAQQFVPGQAGIPQPALRVQDPQLRRPSGRPEAIPRDADLDPLPHHLAPEPDPGPTAQFQPERRDLGQGARQG